MVAAELDEQLSYFGGIQQIRWVASQHRALCALHNNYGSMCSHLETIATLSNKSDAAKAAGLLKRLKSPKFLTFLLFMIDFTSVIGQLSQAFQANDLLVLDVLPRLENVTLALIDMKTSPGKCVASINTGHQYKKVTLSGEVTPELTQQHKDMLDLAIDFIDSRFSGLQNPPLSDFAIFNFTHWPYDVTELTTFGKENLERLITQFAPLLSEEEVDAIPREWLAFKMHVRKLRTSNPLFVFRDLVRLPPTDFKHILPLIEIMLTLSMRTAVVERGFSHMKNIKDPTHTLLGSNNLNNLLEIKINGPSLDDFAPEAAILHWMDKGKGTRHVNGHKH